VPTLVNAYATIGQISTPSFPHTPVNQRDLSDPELAEHLRGFRGYVLSKAGDQMTKTLYQVVRHIGRVQNQVSFFVEDDDLELIEDWAWRSNAIMILPDGSVRDPAGYILVDPEGAPAEPEARVPYPKDAVDRKAESDSELADLDITVPVDLPPVIGAGEVRLRPAADIARRMLALFVVSVRAESLGTKDPISPTKLINDWPIGFAALSPTELKFIQTQEPAEQDIANFAWRYEALTLLQWALCLTDDLSLPVEICDVPAAAKIAIDNNTDAFVDSARLRPINEILDALDIHYRLDWAVTQARVDGRPAPGGLDAGVVYERHYALNWMVRFEDAEWDDVTTPT